MKLATISPVLLLAILLTGCTTGTRFSGPAPAQNDKAVVYLYYESGVLTRKPAQDIFVNGEKVVKILPGSFYQFQAQPGKLVFSDQPNPPTGSDWASAVKSKTILELTVQPGKVYYVERVYVLGIPKGAGRFEPRDYAHAVDGITDCFQVEGAGGAQVAVASRRDDSIATVAGTRTPDSTIGPVAPETRPADPVAPVAPERRIYDSVLTEDCKIVAATAIDMSALDSLIAFLKEQKENRDFDQISKIEFTAADRAMIVFTWSRGTHLGTLTVVKESGAWRITSESHSM